MNTGILADCAWQEITAGVFISVDIVAQDIIAGPSDGVW